MPEINEYSPENLLTVHKNKDGNNDTAYSDKPLNPVDDKIVIQTIDVRSVIRTPVDIAKWRNAHIIAENRYFPNRTWLYDLYADVELDGHLTGLTSKRIDAILNKELYFEVNGKKIDALDQLIGTIAFRNVLKTILLTQFWGISGIEFLPGKVFSPRIIPRKHIKPKWQRITFEQNGDAGIDYTDAKNIFIIGEPEDLGLLLKIAPYVIYKRNMLADWGQYIEIFGQPVRVLYYNAHDKQAKIELKEVLDEAGSALALLIPEGTKFEMPPMPAANATGQLQETFKDTLNSEMSIMVLGNTETTGSATKSGGSLAKSKTHAQQQDVIAKSDMIYLTAYLNNPQFLQVLASYGYPVEGGRFVHTKEFDIDYLEKKIGIDTQLPEDLPIDDDYWYNTYGIPKPDNYDTLKKALVNKQKELKSANDIANDPLNRPGKKKQKQVPNLSADSSVLETIKEAFKRFFVQAR